MLQRAGILPGDPANQRPSLRHIRSCRGLYLRWMWERDRTGNGRRSCGIKRRVLGGFREERGLMEKKKHFTLGLNPKGYRVLCMTTLIPRLIQDKDSLNLSELSRRIGYSPQYLKHVVAGRRRLSRRAERLLNVELEGLCTRLATKKGV